MASDGERAEASKVHQESTIVSEFQSPIQNGHFSNFDEEIDVTFSGPIGEQHFFNTIKEHITPEQQLMAKPNSFDQHFAVDFSHPH